MKISSENGSRAELKVTHLYKVTEPNLRFPAKICGFLRFPAMRENKFQKNPRVRKIFVRNSGAGNGCANLNLWVPGKMRPFCRKNNVHQIPRFRGGVFWVLGGGGGC